MAYPAPGTTLDHGTTLTSGPPYTSCGNSRQPTLSAHSWPSRSSQRHSRGSRGCRLNRSASHGCRPRTRARSSGRVVLRVAPDGGSVVDVKAELSGSELANFAAFYKRSWRDQRLGRLDAVGTLLNVLLRAEERRDLATGNGTLTATREVLTARRHWEIVARELPNVLSAAKTPKKRPGPAVGSAHGYVGSGSAVVARNQPRPATSARSRAKICGSPRL